MLRGEIPRCKNPNCPRSQTEISQEQDQAWVFHCRTCDGVFVLTKDYLARKEGDRSARARIEGRFHEEMKKKMRRYAI